jgi:Ser/Thr protein kinase RdoA (MazF antagonist)
MSRTGIEPKPAWRTVPRAVRQTVADALGSPVVAGQRVWGGFTPTPTFRLRLQAGRRAFFKAVYSDSNEFSRHAHQREERIYRELGDLIHPWAPQLLAIRQIDDWQIILLEDLGSKSVPPWTPRLARNVARAFGDFHQATLGRSLPEWIPCLERQLLIRVPRWELLAQSEDLQEVAKLAGEQAVEALSWLEQAAPILDQSSRTLLDAGEPNAFLHRDVRSDNLRWLDGRLRLFDWPHVGVGPAEYDAAAFAQSVTTEGGPDPEVVMAWYAERAPVRSATLDSAVAFLAGFFADQAWRSEVPGLPRLRAFQQRQLVVTLGWASQRLDLPRPTWLQGLGHRLASLETAERDND